MKQKLKEILKEFHDLEHQAAERLFDADWQSPEIREYHNAIVQCSDIVARHMREAKNA